MQRGRGFMPEGIFFGARRHHSLSLGLGLALGILPVGPLGPLLGIRIASACLTTATPTSSFGVPPPPVETPVLCSAQGPTTLRITVGNYVTRTAYPGESCSLGMVRTRSIQSIDAATVQIPGFAFSPNSTTTDILNRQRTGPWQGFFSPMTQPVPDGQPASVVYTITAAPGTSCTQVLGELRSGSIAFLTGVALDDGTPLDCFTAVSTGDPHLASFDGALYDFHARGDFILATDGKAFTVQVRQEPMPQIPQMAFNSMVAIKLGATRVVFDLRHQPPLFINGVPTDLTTDRRTLPGGGEIRRNTFSYAVIGPKGERVIVLVWRDNLEARVQLPLGDPRLLVGLLGTRDGNLYNELRTRDGLELPAEPTIEQFYGQFGESWRVRTGESLFPTPSPTIATASGTSGTSSTGALAAGSERPLAPPSLRDVPAPARRTAERICRAQGIGHPALLEACMIDVGLSGQDEFAAQVAALPAPRMVLKLAARPPALSLLGASDQVEDPGDAEAWQGGFGCHIAGQARPPWLPGLLGLLLLLARRWRRHGRWIPAGPASSAG